MKEKMLIFCKKSKPILTRFRGKYNLGSTDKNINDFWHGEYNPNNVEEVLNGRIVLECDYDVEEIKWNTTDWVDNFLTTKSMSEEELRKRSCVNGRDLREYFEICYDSISNSIVGYAIHIKNLNVFEKSKGLNSYHSSKGLTQNLKSTPRDYSYMYDYKKGSDNSKIFSERYIFLQVTSEEMYRILKGEQTVVVKKRIIKPMLRTQK